MGKRSIYKLDRKDYHFLILFLFVVVLPFLAIYGVGLPRWVGRLIGTGIGICSLNVWMFGLALNPWERIVPLSARLKATTAYVLEIIFRLFFLLIALMGVWTLIVPYSRGVLQIAKGVHPIQQRERIVNSNGPFGGLIFLYQNVRVSSGPTGKGLMQFYAFPVLQFGRTYILTVLPKSRYILQADEVR